MQAEAEALEADEADALEEGEEELGLEEALTALLEENLAMSEGVFVVESEVAGATDAVVGEVDEEVEEDAQTRSTPCHLCCLQGVRHHHRAWMSPWRLQLLCLLQSQHQQ